MIKKLNFTCCFCNKRINETDVDPGNINFMANYGKETDHNPSQDFFCHFACLKSCLHDYYKGYFLKSAFSLEDDEEEDNEIM